jgi:hypothetical protein
MHWKMLMKNRATEKALTRMSIAYMEYTWCFRLTIRSKKVPIESLRVIAVRILL